MNFSTDRDLLVDEPALFNDVAYVGQQRLRVTDGAFDGTTLTSAAADFVASGVEPGGVVLIAGVPHEVIVRTDANTLGVSLLRLRLSDAPLPGVAGSNLEVIARTFAPQAGLVHDHLLRLLGLTGEDGGPDEDALVSLSVMARLEALGTLERVYSGAAALVGDNDGVLLKAGDYRERFRWALRGAVVLLDLDGDGRADTRRRPGVLQLQRA